LNEWAVYKFQLWRSLWQVQVPQGHRTKKVRQLINGQSLISGLEIYFDASHNHVCQPTKILSSADQIAAPVSKGIGMGMGSIVKRDRGMGTVARRATRINKEVLEILSDIQ